MHKSTANLFTGTGHEVDHVVFSEETIRNRVAEMGHEIAEHYRDREELLVVGLLKGSFIFVADLVRSIPIPLHVDFFIASSYGNRTVSSGDVKMLYDSSTELAGRNVLVVEDIIDSGTTLSRLMPLLESRGPASVELCALLDKGLASLPHPPKWVGFDAPRDFLVGYGLDYSEHFRHLPFIAALRQDT